MGTRYEYIEKILRLAYGTQPSDDSTISYNLVNAWLNEGIGIAIKKNYLDNTQLDGISYVNNSFYTTFKGLSLTKDSQNLYLITLPEVPVAIGYNQGVNSLRITDSNGNISFDAVPLTINQVTYYKSMRPIQNKLMYYSEGNSLYVLSPLQLNVGGYTATVRLASGGDSSNLDSVLNVPSDYLPIIDDFIIQKLMAERASFQKLTDDGTDVINQK